MPGRRRSRRVRLAAVLCGLTLTAAACGGDDDDDADSTAPAGSVSGGTEPADVAETEETQASQESVAETDATETGEDSSVVMLPSWGSSLMSRPPC